MPDTVKVLWRIEDGKVKGRIMEDGLGRTKIVFVANDHRGRLPKEGEATEAAVVKDTKPHLKGSGALMVMPKFAPDPDALDEAAAKARAAEAKYQAELKKQS